MLVENVVAQMIRDAGHTPYFYAKSDRHDAQNRMEIDFLVDRPTLARRHNVSPVEVKSGHNIQLTAKVLREIQAIFVNAISHSRRRLFGKGRHYVRSVLHDAVYRNRLGIPRMDRPQQGDRPDRTRDGQVGCRFLHPARRAHPLR